MRWWNLSPYAERAQPIVAAPASTGIPREFIGTPEPPALLEALRIVAKAGYWTVLDCESHCSQCGAPKPWKVIQVAQEGTSA
jgi:hypothetical protein